MPEKSLSDQRIDLLQEAEEIGRIVEPLMRRREALLRRATAIETVLEPLDPRPGDLIEAGFRARVPGPAEGRTFYVRPASPRVSVSDAPAVYRPSPPVEPGVDASVLITQILEDARRPLHRSEILYRSIVHPLGPLNANTMSTRLSRDHSFERLRRRPGYWVIKDWPDEWSRPERIQPEGRVYADALQQLVRERRRLRDLHQETSVMERRLAELRIRPPTGDEEIERYRRMERFLVRHLERLSFDSRRAHARVTSLWQAALAAQEALGGEREKYPPVPPIDQQAADRAADQAGELGLLDEPGDREEGEDG